jgi:hypothetical protein
MLAIILTNKLIPRRANIRLRFYTGWTDILADLSYGLKGWYMDLSSYYTE